MAQRFVPYRAFVLYLGLWLLTAVLSGQLLREDPPRRLFVSGLLSIYPFIHLSFHTAFSFAIITIKDQTLEIRYPLRIFFDRASYPISAIASIDLALRDHRKGGRGRYLSVLLNRGFERDVLAGDAYIANHRHMFLRAQQIRIAKALHDLGVNAGPLGGA